MQRRLLCLWWVMWWPAASAAAEEALPAGNRVVVSLRPEVSTAQRVVTLSEVARLEGGTAELRRRIAKLDLAEFDALAPTLVIRKELVDFRLQLDGLSGTEYCLAGAASVRVLRNTIEVRNEDIVQAATEAVRRQAPWPAERLLVRPVEPAALPQPLALAAGDKVRLVAELPALAVPLGRVRVAVALEVNGDILATLQVGLDVKVEQDVATAVRLIERGEPLGPDNLRLTKRLVDAPQLLAPGNAFFGKKAKRPLQPGQPVSSADVEDAAEEGAVLIRPRQQVRLLARRGGLHVTTLGEALQEGRAGQRIRVRNLTSKAELQGRVLDENTVEIDF